MPDSASRARSHYRRQQRIALAAVAAVRRAFRRDPGNIPAITRTVSAYQLASATAAVRTLAAEAARTPVANAAAFVGRTALGYPLDQPVATILDRISADMAGDLAKLTADMLTSLDLFVESEVISAGRDAAGVEIYAEPDWTNYVRVLVPPSCDRCTVLAGRVYRDNEGFLRHPKCDCQHWPVTSWEQAHDEGLMFSAADAFEKGQIRGLSAADAQAIRDGADIAQIVNAKRDMRTTSIFGRDGVRITLAGTTRRSAWRKANPNRPIRLRPESIYDLARDREDALRLLKLYGYLI